MTGNNSRSPIYPYATMPFQKDYEGIRDFHRINKIKFVELMTTYKVLYFEGHVHPQREEADYSPINDAEYRSDL